MAAIKDIGDSARKWANRAAVAGEDYRQGIANPRQAWDTASIAADGNYRQGVTAAASAGRYAAGIRKAGVERWRKNATTKGPQRFAEGVNLATDEWQAGFGPYQAAINSLQLPARGPAGSAQNLQRVTAVAQALRRVKEGQGSR